MCNRRVLSGNNEGAVECVLRFSTAHTLLLYHPLLDPLSLVPTPILAVPLRIRPVRSHLKTTSLYIEQGECHHRSTQKGSDPNAFAINALHPKTKKARRC